MQEVLPIQTYKGRHVNFWQIKDYLVSENRGKWFCTCSLKYKRNPIIRCKHIKLIIENKMDKLKEIYRKQIKIHESLVSNTKVLLQIAREGMDAANAPEKRKLYTHTHHQLKAMLYEYEDGVKYWNEKLARTKSDTEDKL